MPAKLLTVIGSTNIDMICQLSHLPSVGETVVGGKFMQTFGGKGANQAVAAARAGGRVTFITCLGDDANAPLCAANFARDGIDCSRVIRRENMSTGVALIMFDQQGRNYLAIASGANHAITPADIEVCAETIRASAMLLMQNEITPEAAIHAMSIAAKASVPVMFNYAPVSAGAIPVNDKMQCLIVNETEAAQLTGHEVGTKAQIAAAAKALAEMGPAVVIITLGAQGSLLRYENQDTHVPPCAVKAVDTTAAGDTYCGALATARLEGMDWKQAVKFASAASAISVTRMGAQPSIPQRHEIDEFIRSSGMLK